MVRRRREVPPRPECQLLLPALSIVDAVNASGRRRRRRRRRGQSQIQAELQRNLVRTESIHLDVPLDAKSVIQQKPVIALLTVRIVNLLSRPDGLQRRDGETLRLLAERPLRLPRPQVIEHVGVRHQRRRAVSVDQQSEVSRAHDHARPSEFVEGGHRCEFGGDGDDGIVVLAYGVGAIGYLDEEVTSAESGEFGFVPEDGHVAEGLGKDVVVGSEEGFGTVDLAIPE
mmetsp:Transcript_8820/g.19093  ORF Transcript_8820/g.19093 Transcript_8820/m.19093 type:complete len:228 (-) Transcript_8820:371-1054(-)